MLFRPLVLFHPLNLCFAKHAMLAPSRVLARNLQSQLRDAWTPLFANCDRRFVMSG
jgi:hypothetical protein